MQVFKSHYSPNPLQDYINKKSLRLTNEQKKLVDRTMNTPGKIILLLQNQTEFLMNYILL